MADTNNPTIARISPAKAHQQATGGNALLICAYDDVERCNKIRLAGSITLEELQNREPDLAKDDALIFYCT